MIELIEIPDGITIFESEFRIRVLDSIDILEQMSRELALRIEFGENPRWGDDKKELRREFLRRFLSMYNTYKIGLKKPDMDAIFESAMKCRGFVHAEI